jgi:hypothetical protein
VNKLELLFDAKQFAVAFGAAVGESRSVIQTCRPDALANSQGKSESVGAGLPGDGAQKVVRAVSEEQCGSRSVLIAGDVDDEV